MFKRAIVVVFASLVVCAQAFAQAPAAKVDPAKAPPAVPAAITTPASAVAPVAKPAPAPEPTQSIAKVTMGDASTDCRRGETWKIEKSVGEVSFQATCKEHAKAVAVNPEVQAKARAHAAARKATAHASAEASAKLRKQVAEDINRVLVSENADLKYRLAMSSANASASASANSVGASASASASAGASANSDGLCTVSYGGRVFKTLQHKKDDAACLSEGALYREKYMKECYGKKGSQQKDFICATNLEI